MPQFPSVLDALPSSFRDPAGYMFAHEGLVYRKVSENAVETFRSFVDSGLCAELIDRGWLVSHEQVSNEGGIVLLPEQVPYVSYPYEWSFSQLKSAALLTLKMQKLAVAHDMSLKDASSYNVQFFGCQPKFIDTLSFEKLEPGQPWVAYKQFCEHFLGPLALMAYVDPSLHKLILGHLEGIPLETVVNLLPTRTKFKYSLLVHLHLHARSQSKHADSAADGTVATAKSTMSKVMLGALLESLTKAVEGCVLDDKKTEWSDYYSETNYSDAAMDAKEQLVAGWLKNYVLENEIVHDIGANTGRFSTLAAKAGSYVVAHDVDNMAVERHYRSRATHGSAAAVLPLQLDLTNPTPPIGWALSERDSFLTRCDSGFVLALALVHHIALGNNTPLAKISRTFAGFARKLIIEFVPKEDSQVKRLLATREDIFPDYNIAGFEAAFGKDFEILEKVEIAGSLRTLYLLESQLLKRANV